MRARFLLMSGLVVVFAVPLLSVAEPTPDSVGAALSSAAPAKTSKQELEELRSQVNQATLKFFETQLEAAAPKVFKLVDSDPKSDVAISALQFLLTPQVPPDTTFKQSALKVLAERYSADGRIGAFLYAASINPQEGRPLLERIVAVNPDRKIQAMALVQLGQMTITALDKTKEPEKQEPLSHEAEAILQRVVDQYGDVEIPGKKLAGEWAQVLLNEMHFRVGQLFPDLEGLSIAGTKEQATSYRGKVVVFDVWATWCGPCVAMIPHERELVEKLKGQPFALISVSADERKADLEKFLEKTAMPWVHWWGQADDGKILKALGIHQYPTIYVVDANGVIRYKNVRGDELTKAVEVCLAEIKEAENGK